MTKILAVDLTALQPSALDSRGNTTSIWPSFCLPWYPGEPPIVGEAARVHRRATDPGSAPGESHLDLRNRARYHLAEGWLEMTRVPDSLQPANVLFSWKPPGEDQLVTVDFPSIVAAYLEPWWNQGCTLALIVPDSLGPGPRQEILDAVGAKFQAVYCVPRSIAAALAWCHGQEGRDVALDSTGEPGKRVGSLIVTTSAADTWEAAVVPLRLELQEETPVLCPVHERSRFSSETGEVGLFWGQPDAARPGPVDARQAWESWLVNCPKRIDRVAPEALRRMAQEAFGTWSFPKRSSSTWTPEGSWAEVLDQVSTATKESHVLAWVHDGESIELSGYEPFNDLAMLIGVQRTELDSNSLLIAGHGLVTQLEAGLVPFFEALASVDLCVIAKNAYQDPVPKWRPLIEATEVAFGSHYRSPEPITDLALPPGRIRSIGLYAQSNRRGKVSLRHGIAFQDEPQEAREPIEVVAHLRPGQGLASLEIRSVRKGGFAFSANEGQMKELALEELPQMKYAWPPGSAYVVSHPTMTGESWQLIESAIQRARGGVASRQILKSIRDTTNKWLKPNRMNVQVTELTFPKEIHPLFVYLGVFPSDPAPMSREVEDRAKQYGDFLVSTFRGAKDEFSRSAVYWSASWLYTRCPELILDKARSHLSGNKAVPGEILACAGNCFNSLCDYSIFFTSFVRAIGHGLGEVDQYWLRAYRNLARFRFDALSMVALADKDQESVLDWYLTLFNDVIMEPQGKVFGFCCRLAPHMLKRRRYDPYFLKEGTAQFMAMNSCLKNAARVAVFAQHKADLSCSLEFLNNRATQHTLELLSEGENS